jgi:hypothetical protein
MIAPAVNLGPRFREDERMKEGAIVCPQSSASYPLHDGRYG